MSASVEMPRYRCYKEVWALKIKALEIHKPTIEELDRILNGGEESPGATITPEEDGYAPFTVSTAFVQKHNPQVGGYYVVYKDGYKSFSPAEAFEDGYTALNKAGAGG